MDGNQPINLSADDLVGILIHNANQAASHLSVHGTNVKWAEFRGHLARMDDLAARAQSMTVAAIDAARRA